MYLQRERHAMATNTAPEKDEVVRFRAPAARKDRWREAAAREGLRLSEWMRRLADRRAEELERRNAADR